MMNKIVLFCGLEITLLASAAELPANKFSRQIHYPESAQQQLLAVSLDEPVYAASTPGFNDLRLLDQTGAETPYLLQKIAERKTVTQHLPVSSKTQTLQKSGEEGIEIRLELDKKADTAETADGLTVVTNQRDFEYSLQIFGSDDARDWQLLVDNGLIYDYSRFMNFSSRDIALPANTFRHFRIIIAKPVQSRAGELMLLTQTREDGEALKRSEQIALHQRPLHIERIDFWHSKTEDLPETEQRFDYPISQFTVTQDTRQKTTLVDIEGNQLPLNGFKLTFDTANFSRQATLRVPSSRGTASSMRTIASTRLEALHFGELSLDNTTVSFPEQRQKNYRIVIEDLDNPPLTIKGITGIGPRYQLVFLSQPEHTYQLKYGAARADAPRYEVAAIEALLRRGYQGTAASLDPAVVSERTDDRLMLPAFLNSRLFLGLMIGVMVIVLGWILFRVAGRIK